MCICVCLRVSSEWDGVFSNRSHAPYNNRKKSKKKERVREGKRGDGGWKDSVDRGKVRAG